jgi:hypothetical protein
MKTVPFLSLLVSIACAETLDAAKQWAAGEERLYELTPNSKDTPVKQVPAFLNSEDCRILREQPIVKGKTRILKRYLKRLLYVIDQVEGRQDGGRKLQDLDIYRDIIVQVPRKDISVSTALHRDGYREGDHNGKSAVGNTAFVFLNTNKDAWFVHGDARVPVEEGKLVIFPSNEPHHTVIQGNQGVQLLGPVDTDFLVAVGGFSSVTVDVNGENPVVSAPGPTFTTGETLNWNITFTNQGDLQYTNLVVTDSELGTITCTKSTLEIAESVDCETTSTAIDGQFASTLTITYDATIGETVVNNLHYVGQEAPSTAPSSAPSLLPSEIPSAAPQAEPTVSPPTKDDDDDSSCHGPIFCWFHKH